MNRILPPVTHPWAQAISRRHEPPAVHFSLYRPCLRWEFGFTCAFCLLHEADIAANGSDGWAFMHVEHFVPQSVDPSTADEYKNCFYICSRCNAARGKAPIRRADGALLLNPCDQPWGQHFKAVADEIQPVDREDDHAQYTCNTYDFNDPRKVRARRSRRRLIGQCIRFLEKANRDHDVTLDQAVDQENPETVKLARDLHKMRRLARAELLRFRAIPHDSDNSCRCKQPGLRTLPKVLADQTFPSPS